MTALSKNPARVFGERWTAVASRSGTAMASAVYSASSGPGLSAACATDGVNRPPANAPSALKASLAAPSSWCSAGDGVGRSTLDGIARDGTAIWSTSSTERQQRIAASAHRRIMDSPPISTPLDTGPSPQSPRLRALARGITETSRAQVTIGNMGVSDSNHTPSPTRDRRRRGDCADAPGHDRAGLAARERGLDTCRDALRNFGPRAGDALDHGSEIGGRKRAG